MSENENNPPVSSGASPGPEEGRVATEHGYPQSPPPTADGAPAAAAERAEDRTTTPAAAGEGAATNGSLGHGMAGPVNGAAGRGATPESGGSAGGASPSPEPGAGPSPYPRPRPSAARADETATAFPGTVPTPPPWRRAPGDEVTGPAGRPAPQRSPAVDSLLSEAPTTYLDRSAPGSATFAGSSQAEVHAEVPAVAGRAPRQALLQVKRFDPWSVLKLALVLAVVLFFIWLVAVGVLYGVLDGMGVWDRLNGTYADLVSGGDQGGGGSLISAGSVFGIAAVIGAINSLLFAVAMTVGAFVYNVSADLVGGIEVTLSERD